MHSHHLCLILLDHIFVTFLYQHQYCQINDLKFELLWLARQTEIANMACAVTILHVICH